MLIETLAAEEARVLGALLEKSLATPDYYPMTLNALRNACNQKSSRDPVSDYDDDTVSLALAGLKRKTLATFVPYGSQPNQFKYRHFLEDARFNLRKPELAVFAVLLLRGAQTLNEIKLRAGSLHPLETLEAAEAVLKALAERPEPLAVLLPKRPGWKEPRWRDTVRAHAEGETAGESAPGSETSSSPGEAVKADGSAAPGRSKWEEFEDLKREVAALKSEFTALKEVVDRIRSELF